MTVLKVNRFRIGILFGCIVSGCIDIDNPVAPIRTSGVWPGRSKYGFSGETLFPFPVNVQLTKVVFFPLYTHRQITDAPPSPVYGAQYPASQVKWTNKKTFLDGPTQRAFSVEYEKQGGELHNDTKPSSS